MIQEARWRVYNDMNDGVVMLSDDGSLDFRGLYLGCLCNRFRLIFMTSANPYFISCGGANMSPSSTIRAMLSYRSTSRTLRGAATDQYHLAD